MIVRSSTSISRMPRFGPQSVVMLSTWIEEPYALRSFFGPIGPRALGCTRSGRYSKVLSGDFRCPSLRKMQSSSRGQCSKRRKTRCFVSNCKTGTKFSRTFRGRCECTTSESFLGTGFRLNSPLMTCPAVELPTAISSEPGSARPAENLRHR